MLFLLQFSLSTNLLILWMNCIHNLTMSHQRECVCLRSSCRHFSSAPLQCSLSVFLLSPCFPMDSAQMIFLKMSLFVRILYQQYIQINDFLPVWLEFSFSNDFSFPNRLKILFWCSTFYQCNFSHSSYFFVPSEPCLSQGHKDFLLCVLLQVL